jgi:hypothetical protein
VVIQGEKEKRLLNPQRGGGTNKYLFAVIYRYLPVERRKWDAV